jgi:hypothetical protein
MTLLDEFKNWKDALDKPDPTEGLVSGGIEPTPRAGLLSVEGVDPDKRGRAMALSDMLGLPLPAVEQDFDRVSYRAQIEQYDNLGDTHPATAAVVADPELAAVVKDNIESLKKVEEVLSKTRRPKFVLPEGGEGLSFDPSEVVRIEDDTAPSAIWKAVRNMAPDTARAWLAGQTQIELSQLEARKMAGVPDEDYETRLEELEKARAALNAIRPEDGNFFSRGFYGAAEVLPQFIEQIKWRLVGAGAGALVGPGGAMTGQQVAGALFSFELEGGSAYNEFKKLVDENGDPLPDSFARVGASVVGAINAGLEMLQFRTFAKMLPGADRLVSQAIREGVAETLKKQTAKEALAAVAKLYATGVTTESLQEAAQRLVTIFGEESVKKAAEVFGDQAFEHKTGTEIAQDVWDEFKGAIETFSFLGAPGAVSKVKPALDVVEKSKQHAEFFEALHESLDGNPVRDRYPPTIRTLVEQVQANAAAAGEEISQIGISARAIETFFQDKPEALPAFLEAAEVSETAYSTALNQDRDIEIPLEAFVQKIAGTSVGRALTNDIRLFPGDATINEAAKEQEHLQSILPERAAEGLRVQAEDAELKAAIDELAPQIMLPGMTEKDARAQLAVLSARARIAATEWTKAGTPMSPAQWITEHVALEVEKTTQAEAERQTTSLEQEEKLLGDYDTMQERAEHVLRRWNRENPDNQLATPQEVPEEFQKKVQVDELTTPWIEAMRRSGGKSLKQEAESITETPEFKKWFGESKVVDESGKPLVVYHGSQKKNIKEFKPKLAENGIYFSSSPDLARTYSGSGKKAQVYETYLSFQSPLIVDAQGEAWRDLRRARVLDDKGNPTPWTVEGLFGYANSFTDKLAAAVRKSGFDSIIIRDVQDVGPKAKKKETKQTLGDVYVALDPKQIKSVANRGTFDPKNPNILEQEIFGRVSFQEDRTLISLFEKANYSTFLHEISHIFFTDLADLVSTGAASEQAKADFDALQRFTEKEEGDVAKQEKLARAFETYLLEGKAPTVELRSAFARFRAWLTAIYRNLQSVMGIEINDEVRGVFDRLLQAEEDIEAAEVYHNVRTSFDALLGETTSEAEKKRFEALDRKRRESALERRTKTLLKAYFSAIGGKAGLKARAEKLVNESSIYALIREVKENGGFLVDAPDATAKIINKQHGRIIGPSGKVDPTLFAVKYGFGSVERMFAALRNAQSRRDAVKETAERLFRAEEKTALAAIEKSALETEYGVSPADADIHSEDALELLIAEAEIYRRKTERKETVTRITARAILDKVRADIAKKPVGKAVLYRNASAAEARASRAAEAAFIKKDLAKAQEQKQLEAYYHAMVLEAVRARDEMTKFHNRLARFLKKLGKIEYAHRQQFLALANRYGLTEKTPDKEVQSLEAFVTAAAADDPNGVPMFSPWLLRGENAGDFRALTLEQAREVNALMEWIVGRGSDHFQALLGQKDISVATWADKGLRAAVGVKSRKVPAERTRLFDVRRKIRGGLSKISQPQFYFLAMDGYKNLDGTTPGPNEQMFRWLADAGAEEKRIYYKDLWPKYQKIFKNIRAAQRRIEKAYGKYFDIPYVPVTPAMEAVGATSWTSERVIAAALNMGNEGNRAALMQGFGLTELQLNQLVRILTAEDWVAVQDMWDLIDTQYKPMDDAYFRINNLHTKKVAAKAFRVIPLEGPAIDVRGGYYPLIFDHMLSDRAEQFRTEDILKNSEAAVTHTPAARSGFTNARTGGLLPPKLSLGIIAQHLFDTVHYYTHAAPVQDIDRITRVPEWKKEFTRIHGREAYAEIRPWLKSIARPERAITDVYDDFLTRQRMLASIAILGFNLKSASKQFLDFSHAMRDLGPGYVGKALWSSWGNWRNAAAEVRESSPYMAQRALVIDREMREVLIRSKPGKRTLIIHGEEYSWNDVEKFAFKFIEMADAAVTIPTWKAAYAKASDLRMPPEEAAKYADNAVRTTQPGADLIDMTALQRSHNWTRLFSMFISPALRQQNRYRYFYGAWRNGKMTSSKYFRHLLYELVAPSFARYAFYLAFLGTLPGDDDGPPPTEIIFNMLDQCLGGIPIINTIPSAVEYARGSSSPVLEGIERIDRFAGAGTKAAKSIWDDETDSREAWSKFAMTTADVVSFELGVGYLPRIAKTFAEGFEDIEEEKTVNPLRLLVKVPKRDRI